MNALRIIIKIALFFGIILIGVGIRGALVATRPPPERTERPDSAVLVETQTVQSETHQLAVNAQGTVVAAQSILVQPQVGGRITWVNEAMVPGGHVAEGDLLLRIDARDYQVAVEQRGSELNRAQLELQVERGRQVVARREWELFGGEASQQTAATQNPEGPQGSLALREPQIQTARVAVDAASSGVRRARLDLGRTTIRAPFDAVVQSENIDVGQVVGPGVALASLIGSHAYWVQVSVPLEVLTRIDVPGSDREAGSVARVWHEVGDQRIEREGRVVRLLGDLDPVGRMARLLVEIPDPLEAEGLPSSIGAYVHVEIDGHSAADLIEVPRIALREGRRVWVVNGDDELEIREVTVVWRREQSVLVSTGLQAGERIITSRILTPVSGMDLRIEDELPEATEARAER